jgi:hypothetical protein
MSERCDILITKQGQVYMNGIRLTNVVSIDVTYDSDFQMRGARLSLEVIPTSIIQGEPPADEVERLHQQVVSDPAGPIDITKAIENVRRRLSRGTGEDHEVPAAD